MPLGSLRIAYFGPSNLGVREKLRLASTRTTTREDRRTP